jgi:hypothetical protein
MFRYSTVGAEHLKRTAIVCRNEQIVSVSVREIAFEAREVLLDHGVHGIIGRVAPAVKRNVD